MHINWGFWGAMLGVATVGSVIEQRHRNGDELAKDLIMLAGTGDDDGFRERLAPYIGKFPGSVNSVWVSAFDAAVELEKYKSARISYPEHTMKFRVWCRSIV